MTGLMALAVTPAQSGFANPHIIWESNVEFIRTEPAALPERIWEKLLATKAQKLNWQATDRESFIIKVNPNWMTLNDHQADPPARETRLDRRQSTKAIHWKPDSTEAHQLLKLNWEPLAGSSLGLEWLPTSTPIPLPEPTTSKPPNPPAIPAYSRGSLIQIGDTIYPNLGFNVLQREPESWGSIALSAIDNSRQGSCVNQNTDLDFFQECADGLAESYVRLWNSKAFSLDLQWTVHSLSGPGSPVPIAGRTGGTEFLAGQSLGFKLARNLGNSTAIAFGSNRLFHLDETTDLPKNLYLMSTSIIRLNKKKNPPIIALSAGLMSDVYNPNTNIGTMQYPPWLLGGLYPSIFAEEFDGKKKNGYYPNVAGTSSAFVCADQSIFAGKPINAANPDCIKQVSIGPVASIGIAPWPWLGFYAKYTANINLGISLKPFGQVPLNISLEAVSPIEGINPVQDRSFYRNECGFERPHSFSDCRTRYGLFIDFSF